MWSQLSGACTTGEGPGSDDPGPSGSHRWHPGRETTRPSRRHAMAWRLDGEVVSRRISADPLLVGLHRRARRRGRGDRVGGRPLEYVVGDLLPAVLADQAVGATRVGLVV